MLMFRNIQRGNTTKSIITDRKSVMDQTSMNVFENRGVAGEQNEVNRLNIDILQRLRERLLETKHRDTDIEKLIEKLPA